MFSPLSFLFSFPPPPASPSPPAIHLRMHTYISVLFIVVDYSEMIDLNQSVKMCIFKILSIWEPGARVSLRIDRRLAGAIAFIVSLRKVM